MATMIIGVVLIGECVGSEAKTGPGGITLPSGFTKHTVPFLSLFPEMEGIAGAVYIGSGTAEDALTVFRASAIDAGWSPMEGEVEVPAAGIPAVEIAGTVIAGAGFEKGDKTLAINVIQAEDQVTVMVWVAPKDIEEVPEKTYLESLVGTTWKGNISGQFNGQYWWAAALDNVSWSWEIEAEITADMYYHKLYLKGPGIVRYSKIESVRVKTSEPYSVMDTWYSDISPEVWPIELTAYIREDKDGLLEFEWGGNRRQEVITEDIPYEEGGGTRTTYRRYGPTLVYSWFVIVNTATTPPFDPEWVTWEDKYEYRTFHVAPPPNRMPVSMPSPPRSTWAAIAPITNVTIENNVMHILYDGRINHLGSDEMPEGFEEYMDPEVLEMYEEMKKMYGHLRYEGTFTKVTDGN